MPDQARCLVVVMCCWAMTGCMTLTVVSTTLHMTTGQGLTELAVGGMTGADCRIAHVPQGHVCELPPDAGQTYNRNSY
jgi:hypothetical protein